MVPRRRVVMRLDHPASWDDLLRVPEGAIGEIVAGELVAAPRPGLPHTLVASDLTVVLGSPFRLGAGGPGGWVILDEPRVRFGDDIRVPDLAGWRRERWTNLPRTGPISVLPDWVCEVLSPSTERDDRTERRALYAGAGVRHYWIVSPAARTVEIHRLGPEGYLIAGSFAAPGLVRAEPFDAVAIDLGQVFGGLGDDVIEEE
jgi:Uma2 family endonuclease